MPNADESIAVKTSEGTVEYAVRADGSMPAREFVVGLGEDAVSDLHALFQHVSASRGIGVSPKNFKHERGDLWTFKRRVKQRNIRLPCFRRGNRWIITHGFVKPAKAEWPEQEFTRAFRIQQEFDEREVRKRKGGR